ncbi:TetR/AcrR family transcriptional regulator [Bradyrhizobium sp. 187]|uniref:TetR/AcrR family transcriptional regulator n=1 Tax=Bradyrhizobium sp. 187 TaxID=2782655 RepID=UPI001FFE5D9C|nr:TetR/AcrR family transcriptional regulator [Bradyrhizobium sp. 187]UPJ71852.1 TetR/AcrR family transcriptional regulator [Bradyrhizobium sp. 187]
MDAPKMPICHPVNDQMARLLAPAPNVVPNPGNDLQPRHTTRRAGAELAARIACALAICRRTAAVQRFAIAYSRGYTGSMPSHAKSPVRGDPYFRQDEMATRRDAQKQSARKKPSSKTIAKAPIRRVVGASENKRPAFEERRRIIIGKAAEFFAESGFSATTRELADHLGTTQPLMYKYFKGKAELIEEVYKSVFLDVWNDRWDELLIDRERPIVERLIEFYISYTDVIMNRGWMRMYLFAGLKSIGITSSYVRLVEERVIRRIAIEICAARKFPFNARNEARYLEIAWSLQGSIFYYGVRKHAYDLNPHVDKNSVIRDAVRIFVQAWPSDEASDHPTMRAS